MAFVQEQREALHLLQGIENGTLRTVDAAHAIDGADPTLVYLIVTWLRAHYGAGHPAAEGVLGRLVELTREHPGVQRAISAGKDDPVVTWFEEQYGYRELSGPDFIALVVDKLES